MHYVSYWYTSVYMGVWACLHGGLGVSNWGCGRAYLFCHNLFCTRAPFVVALFNRSLAADHFPARFKEVFLTPIVKKPGLDITDVCSYRPIGIAPEYLGPVVRVADLPVDSLFALLALTARWCHHLNCQQLTLELSRWPVLASGIVCQQTLHRHRRRWLSANDLKLIYFDNRFLISPFNNMHSLGGPCGDIHLGHFKKH